MREVEGLVKDYEGLVAEKEALEQQAAQQEGRHTQLGRELEQAQLAVQQIQQVSLGSPIVQFLCARQLAPYHSQVGVGLDWDPYVLGSTNICTVCAWCDILI